MNSRNIKKLNRANWSLFFGKSGVTASWMEHNFSDAASLIEHLGEKLDEDLKIYCLAILLREMVVRHYHPKARIVEVLDDLLNFGFCDMEELEDIVEDMVWAARDLESKRMRTVARCAGLFFQHLSLFKQYYHKFLQEICSVKSICEELSRIYTCGGLEVFNPSQDKLDKKFKNILIKALYQKGFEEFCRTNLEE